MGTGELVSKEENKVTQIFSCTLKSTVLHWSLVSLHWLPVQYIGQILRLFSV